jgi:hypothetical protein
MKAHMILVLTGVFLGGCYPDPITYGPSYPPPYAYMRPYLSAGPLYRRQHGYWGSGFPQPKDDRTGRDFGPEADEPPPNESGAARPVDEREVIGPEDPSYDRKERDFGPQAYEANVPPPNESGTSRPVDEGEVIGADDPPADRSLPRMVQRPVPRHRDHAGEFSAPPQ